LELPSVRISTITTNLQTNKDSKIARPIPFQNPSITMETTNQTGGGGGGGGGDEYSSSSSSSSQIFDILISDFLSPLKLSYNNKASNNKKDDLILQQKLVSSGNTLLTIVRNALRSHQSEKFRKVRLSNPKVSIVKYQSLEY
jgi:hypothetical protein